MATATSTDFTLKPFFVQAPSGDAEIDYTATDFRALVSAIWPRYGILSPTSYQVKQQDVVGWGIQVYGGWAAVGAAGPTAHDVVDRYLVVNETAITVSLAGFNTNPAGTRTHRVYLAVYDKQVAGSTTATAKIVVTEDTTGAGAPAPTGVADSMLLGYVTIGPGQSYVRDANIIDARQHGSGGANPGAGNITLHELIVDAATLTNTSPAVTAMYRDGRVYLSGAVMRSVGSASFYAGTTYELGTVGEIFRPANTKAFIVATGLNILTGDDAYNDFYTRVVIFPSGQISAYMPAGNTTKYIYFDQISYELDV